MIAVMVACDAPRCESSTTVRLKPGQTQGNEYVAAHWPSLTLDLSLRLADGWSVTGGGTISGSDDEMPRVLCPAHVPVDGSVAG